MVKKTQSVEGKNPTFLAFPHPDWFLPYRWKKLITTGTFVPTGTANIVNNTITFISVTSVTYIYYSVII